MRVIIQRVLEAKVVVDSQTVGQIDQGLLILLGIHDDDNKTDIDWLVQKLIGLRIFNDDEDKMNYSILDVKGKFLVISQFTLYANTKKGNRPSFINAAKPEKAKTMYETFIENLSMSYGPSTEKGIFGADMKVSLINDGPVTIFIDSKARE